MLDLDLSSMMAEGTRLKLHGQDTHDLSGVSLRSFKSHSVLVDGQSISLEGWPLSWISGDYGVG
jgi:hypothetical protein